MTTQLEFPPVLDACCGSRMFWFNKQDDRALFVDKRRETHPIDIGTPGTIGKGPIVVNPDILADFSNLPFPDESFYMVVFDPPHMIKDFDTGFMSKKYGLLNGDWQSMISKGFSECFRVLRPFGTLVFKWADVSLPVSRILELTPHKPLFGHKTAKKCTSHWVVFMKP